ncbi:hypothetical protein BH09VER1_BH09VER1_44020 [soil metagenome]
MDLSPFYPKRYNQAHSDGVGQRAAAGELSGLRLLVVEDHDDCRMMLKFALVQRGAEVETATHGAEALEKFASGFYDVVVSDINMPLVDGLTMMREIRASGRPVTAIALTASPLTSERATALEYGFDAHLYKPVDIADLVREVLACERRRKA